MHRAGLFPGAVCCDIFRSGLRRGEIGEVAWARAKAAPLQASFRNTPRQLAKPPEDETRRSTIRALAQTMRDAAHNVS
jgi:hypothetical protein